MIVLVGKTPSFHFNQLSEELQVDPDIAFAALDNFDDYIDWISSALLADSSFVLEAVKRYGSWVVSYVSMDLRNDRGFIREAIALAPRAFYHAGDDLQEDTEFVIENIRQNGVKLEDLRWRAHKNRAIVIAAVQQDPASLQHATPSSRVIRRFRQLQDVSVSQLQGGGSKMAVATKKELFCH